MEDDEIPEPISLPNYSSAITHEDILEQTYLEERDLGMTLGPFTKAEAAAICGCAPEELCCGPLGAREESDKIRTIHDGTAIHVNTHIRSNSSEKTTAPGLADLQTALIESRTDGRDHLAAATGADPGASCQSLEDELILSKQMLPKHTAESRSYRRTGRIWRRKSSPRFG